jgi:glutathione peroxidase-family protein
MQLAEWHKEYPGLEIVLFPTDEFGAEELPAYKIPGFVSAYGLPTDGDGCTVMAKVQTNGQSAGRGRGRGAKSGAHPVWAYITSVFPGEVSWNFGCWALFDADGSPVGRYSADPKEYPGFTELGDSLRLLIDGDGW